MSKTTAVDTYAPAFTGAPKESAISSGKYLSAFVISLISILANSNSFIRASFSNIFFRSPAVAISMLFIKSDIFCDIISSPKFISAYTIGVNFVFTPVYKPIYPQFGVIFTSDLIGFPVYVEVLLPTLTLGLHLVISIVPFNSAGL